MVDFLLLVNQMISKFKTSVGSILEEVYPDIASRAFLILSQDAFQACPGGTTEVKLLTVLLDFFFFFFVNQILIVFIIMH